MVTRIFLLLFLVIGVSACGDPEPGEGREDAVFEDYAGDWEGVLKIMGQSLPLVLHVEPGAEKEVTLDSPAQGAFGIEASDYSVDDGVLNVAWSSLGARYAGRLSEDGEMISGQFSQNGPSFELDFTRQTDAAPEAPQMAEDEAPNRPQEPNPPFPYEVIELAIAAENGAPQLGGTLTMPNGEGPFPGVVLLTGSGAQDRDETILGHKPFKLIADRLTRRGIAVLRLDDRGVGESGGDFIATTMEDKAADARRAMARMGEEEGVGPVGLLGHSEGGMVAFMAAQGTDPAFIITLAGPYQQADVLIVDQLRLALERSGAPAELVEQQVALQRSLLDAALVGETPDEACASVAEAAKDLPAPVQAQTPQLCTPSYFSFLRVDIAAAAGAYDGPVLALFGEKDFQVPPQTNADAVAEIFGGRENVSVEIVEGANHLFQTAETGLLNEYEDIEETMQEQVLTRIGDFIAAQADE